MGLTEAQKAWAESHVDRRMQGTFDGVVRSFHDLGDDRVVFLVETADGPVTSAAYAPLSDEDRAARGALESVESSEQTAAREEADRVAIAAAEDALDQDFAARLGRLLGMEPEAAVEALAKVAQSEGIPAS